MIKEEDIVKKYPLDVGLENIINNINDTCGEEEQFRLIIRLLNNLIGWQGLSFSNNNEKMSFELNLNLLELLKMSYETYQGKESE